MFHKNLHSFKLFVWLIFTFSYISLTAQIQHIPPNESGFAVPASYEINDLVPLQWYTIFFDHDLTDMSLYSYFNENEITNSYVSNGLVFFIPKYKSLEFHHPGYTIKKVRRDILKVEKVVKSTPSKSMFNIEPITGVDPADLVSQYLLGDFCLNVENINTQGGPNGYGRFLNGESSIGIELGIMLASGSINNALGPNNTTSSTSTNGGPADPDLNAIAGGGTNDVAILEFDFVPDEDSISFDYVFASEEYCEYVGSFNDAFGFFLSGPGINGPYSGGAINIALIPGTQTPVSINTVNASNNAEYYVDNYPIAFGQGGGCTFEEANTKGFSEEFLQYDGFTKVLTAKAEVIPCETYHIKLAVGDFGDSAWDSAVFIGGNTFVSGEPQPKVTFDVVYENNQDAATEGCTGAYIAFRKWGFTFADIVFDIFISGSSTATEGVDYGDLPDFVDLSPGKNRDTIFLDIFSDLLQEGEESIIIELKGVCECLNPMIEVLIQDPPEIITDISRDQEICVGEFIELEATAEGGTPDFEFVWSNGDTGPSISEFVTATETFYVTITDLCGQEKIEEATITVHEEYFEQYEAVICEGETYTIGGVPYSNPGIYTNDYSSIWGCDSIIETELIVLEKTYSDTTIVTCFGDCGFVDGQAFCAPGTYVLPLPGMAYNGCDSIINIQMEWLQPFAGILNPDIITCENTSVQLHGLDITNGGGVTYVWTGPDDFESNELEPWVSVPGDYEFYIIQTFGDVQCLSNDFEVEVMIDTIAPSIDPGDDVTIACGITSVDLTGMSIGGESEDIIEYFWTLPDGTIDSSYMISVSDSGTYIFSVVNLDNMCSTDSSIHVAIDNVEPVITSQGAQLGCSANSVQLFTTVNIGGGTYSWTGPNGFTSNQKNPFVPEIGTYTVEYYISSNCIASVTVEVTEDNTVPEVTPIESSITCADPNAQLSFDSPNFDSNYWEGPNGYYSDNETINVTEPGTYTLVVSGSNGCTVEFNIIVEDLTYTPDVSIVDGLITCDEPTVNLELIGQDFVSFNWSGPSGFNSQDESPSVNTPGTYTVTVTDVNGCTNTAQTALQASTQIPNFTLNQPILNCINSSVDLIPSSTSDIIQYDWAGPGGFVSNEEIISITEAGAYVLIVTSTNGCTFEQTVNINSNFELPVFTVMGDTLNCATGNANLAADISGGNYSIKWIDDLNATVSNSPNATVSEAGIYFGIVTNITSGCKDTLTAEIVQDADAPDLTTLGDTIDCLSTLFTVNAISNLAITYKWAGPNSFSSDLPNPNVTTPGLYSVTVTADNGCSTVETVEVIKNNEKPFLNGNSDTINCFNPVATIDLMASGIGNVYNWTGPSGFSSQDEILTGVDLGGTYQVTVTSSNGCSNTKNYNIISDMEIPTIATVLSNNLDCTNTSANINVTTNAKPGYDVTWNGPGGFTSTDLNIQVTTGGAYNITIVGINGCESSFTVDVTQSGDAIQIETNDDHLDCNVTQVALDASYSSGVIEFIEWTGPNGFNSNEENPIVDEPGTYVVVVEADNGCKTESTINITEDINEPTTSLYGDELSCLQETVIITTDIPSNSGLNIDWIGPNGVSVGNSNALNVTSPGMYTIEVEDPANGCSYVSSIFIEEIDAVREYDLLSFDPACVPNSGVIEFIDIVGGVGPYMYSIDGGQTFQNSPYFDGLVEGNYETIIQDATGCIIDFPVELIGLESYEFTDIPNIELTLGNSTQINIQTTIPEAQIAEIIWTPSEGLSCSDCLNPLLTPSTSGTYRVTIIDVNGCEISTTIEVRVKVAGIYVPNIFSPNGDGVNDGFEVFANKDSVEEILKLSVYDRWGNLVFNVEDKVPGDKDLRWDGEFNGKIAQTGVYVYSVSYKLANGEVVFQTGDVTIVR